MPRKKLASFFASTATKTSNRFQNASPRHDASIAKSSLDPVHVADSPLPPAGTPSKASPGVSLQVLARLKKSSSTNTDEVVAPGDNQVLLHLVKPSATSAPMPEKKLASLFASTATKTSNRFQNASPRQDVSIAKRSLNPIHVADLPSPPAGTPSKASPGVSLQVLARLKKSSSTNTNEVVAPGKESAIDIASVISSILCGDRDKATTAPHSSRDSTGDMPFKNVLDFPWFSNGSQNCTTQSKKILLRERKKKYIFKNVESRRFIELMKKCADKLGTESTLQFFEKLGRETGVKEYNTLIKLCIDKARGCRKEEDSLVYINKVHGLFLSMIEKGMPIEEESYGPLLNYMIDKKILLGFQMFIELFKNEIPDYSRIGYYEMVFWIMVGNEEKIEELLDLVKVGSFEDKYPFIGFAETRYCKESYLLAFCRSGSDRKKDLLQLLEIVDMGRISSPKCIECVFRSLGTLQLEDLAEKYFFELNTAGLWKEDISSFICKYVTSLPNLVVEDVISKFINTHQKLGIAASIASYEKLISLCCSSNKVCVSLDIVDHMYKSGLCVPIEVLSPILHACEQSGQLEMVHPIFLVMRQHNLQPTEDTLKRIIHLYMKMKDFEGAYNVIIDAQEMNVMPTTAMYNAIMAGYFREKNNHRALMVLKQMEHANLKPDSETYSYLIANCECEEDIVKYREQMCRSEVGFTKYIYMSLVNAYAKFGNFEMAKQIILNKEIPVNYLNEINGVLMSALSSNGQIHDALGIYAEIKRSGANIEPKAVISLLEHLQTEGELDRLLQLLEELKDSNSWFDGCSRVILYCIQYNLTGYSELTLYFFLYKIYCYLSDASVVLTSSALELLKKLKEKDVSSANLIIGQMFSQIFKTPTNLKSGFELLQGVKELGLHPSRTCLDFLLSTCVKAENSQMAWRVWSEYETSGLAYNSLTFIRMYQALLASKEFAAAKELLKRIPREDRHVQYLIKACETRYCIGC
ncbi:hypothetical protein ZIOFF_016364 [Zingiber officinale]|uniref:Pentatricopeptide repeat-containing protein n=1 Tax=Zingiber officinale TaxID=94328 RepID=A0A8J5LX90_ZINOF|nr:hypothetical protein ZIOFF_016364 [Zingiber officinale]